MIRDKDGYELNEVVVWFRFLAKNGYPPHFYCPQAKRWLPSPPEPWAKSMAELGKEFRKLYPLKK